MSKRVVTLKIYYDTTQCSEKDIVEEIENWPDIEECNVVGNARADRQVSGSWPED